MNAVIWAALPQEARDTAGKRPLGPFGRVEVRPWQECEEDGGILLLAPHEYSDDERLRIVHARHWSWVHLSSAGVDFMDLASWPGKALLTRSWRCYAAPLAEYVLHAVLSREWSGAVPWEQSDPRQACAGDGAPVPEFSAGAESGVFGTRVGIAGWGEVGRRVGAVLGALGAEVVVLRRSGSDGSTAGVEVVHDPRRIVDVDHLVVALPLTESTHRIFDREVLRHCRPGTHVVNVSRPQLIDQEALLELCATGRARATLDVTEPEPLPPGHPLLALPTVRISPHIAWRSGRGGGSGMSFLDDFALLADALAADGDLPAGAAAAGDRLRAMERVRTTRRQRCVA